MFISKTTQEKSPSFVSTIELFDWQSLVTYTCKCIVLPTNYYTPDIRSMWGYIVFAFPSVRSFIGTFVHLFVHSSFRYVRGQGVKDFALKFIRPHILKTLWWISFIFGLMVDIGLKFLSASSPPQGWPWDQSHRIFIKKSNFFVFKFI